ncbi:MAG: zinc finger MYND domain-containing protein [Chlamydiales bacterium]|nr:zinc finger MYND domain-containing protein [Chlamydiales bacterium]
MTTESGLNAKRTEDASRLLTAAFPQRAQTQGVAAAVAEHVGDAFMRTVISEQLLTSTEGTSISSHSPMLRKVVDEKLLDDSSFLIDFFKKAFGREPTQADIDLLKRSYRSRKEHEEDKMQRKYPDGVSSEKFQKMADKSLQKRVKELSKEGVIECSNGCDTWAKIFPKCTRCFNVAYCSKACQKAHWPAHKAACVIPAGAGAKTAGAGAGAGSKSQTLSLTQNSKNRRSSERRFFYAYYQNRGSGERDLFRRCRGSFVFGGAFSPRSACATRGASALRHFRG